MTTPRVLVACEFSGIVRDAFRARGFDAWSCDLLPTERPGPHIEGDAIEAAERGAWDLIIAHPPCDHLAVSGARWFAQKRADGRQAAAIGFFLMFVANPVRRLAIENPVGIMSTEYRKPDQIIQPWQFGHGETKATCLWLRNLPCLTPTCIVDGRANRVHREAPSPERWKNRSRTLPGIADAMAEQWGDGALAGRGLAAESHGWYCSLATCDCSEKPARPHTHGGPSQEATPPTDMPSLWIVGELDRLGGAA